MGSVSGSVADQTGAPLPGVRVAIQGVATRTAETGAAGDFAFPDLSEGHYEISAELSGFERAHRAVRVKAGERVTVILTLRVVLVENRDRHRRQDGRTRRPRGSPRDSVVSPGRSRAPGR